MLFRGCSRSFSLPLSLALSISLSHGQRMLLDSGGCAKRNETKTENAQKDEMKTQRKRETKETKAKRQKRQRQQQQPRAFRTAAAAAQFPVEWNDVFIKNIYDEYITESNNKKKNTMPIVVVVAVSRYVFAFLPPRHLPQSKASHKGNALSAAKTFCIFVARLSCCSCCCYYWRCCCSWLHFLVMRCGDNDTLRAPNRLSLPTSRTLLRSPTLSLSLRLSSLSYGTSSSGTHILFLFNWMAKPKRSADKQLSEYASVGKCVRERLRLFVCVWMLPPPTERCEKSNQKKRHAIYSANGRAKRIKG